MELQAQLSLRGKRLGTSWGFLLLWIFSVSDFEYIKGACTFPVHKGGDRLGGKELYPHQVVLGKCPFYCRARPLLECLYFTFRSELLTEPFCNIVEKPKSKGSSVLGKKMLY